MTRSNALRRPRALMLTGASALALMLAQPAAAQTLTGLKGALAERPAEGAGVDLQKVSVRALRIRRCAPKIEKTSTKRHGGAPGAQIGKTSWDRLTSAGTKRRVKTPLAKS